MEGSFTAYFGTLATIAIALAGHAGTTWYKLGRIEGKIDVLCTLVQRNAAQIDKLKNGDRK